jgi:LPXTG-motif cell wall-anchored protein
MTRVKTGPEMYIFMALIAILLTSGLFFMRKNNA